MQKMSLLTCLYEWAEGSLCIFSAATSYIGLLNSQLILMFCFLYTFDFDSSQSGTNIK